MTTAAPRRLKIAHLLIYGSICAFASAAWGRPNGQLKATVDSYPTHLGESTEDLVPYVNTEIGDKYRLGRRWRAQWRLFALSNTTAKGAPENLYGDLPEGLIEYRAGSRLKLRAGMDTINWGMTDVNSPSDTVNTVALFHPLRTHKQGAPMLQTQIGGDRLNLDLLYVPIQRRPQMPSVNSRWLPRSFLMDVEAEGEKILIPKFIEYEWDKPQTLDRALQHGAGAKLASHLDGLDLQLTYYRGAATSPKVLPTQLVFDANELRSPVHLTAYTYLVETTGFGFAWARENWIFRGESAYQHTLSDRSFLQPWSWSNVLAVETNLEVSSKTITILAQAYWAKNPQPADNLISSSYRLFDETLLLGGRLAWSDDLTFLLSSLYENNTRGLFWMVGFEQKLKDQLRWGLGWRALEAQRDGLIKTFERNDHATLELTYFF